jgi:hypothetical protein
MVCQREADMNTYLVTLTVDDDSHSVYVTADNVESAFAEAVALYPWAAHVQPRLAQLVAKAP